MFNISEFYTNELSTMKLNSSRFKAVALLLMAALFMPAGLIAQGSKSNFSGNWVYNADKSNE